MASLVLDSLTSASTEDLLTYSGNWTYSQGQLQITTNGVQSAHAGNNGAFWNTQSFNADQWAQCTLNTTASATSFMGLGLRMAATGGGQGYYAYVELASTPGNNYFDVGYISGGTKNRLTLTQHQSFAAGDVISFTVVGSTLTLLQNNTVIYRTTDTNIASGSPGLQGFSFTSGCINSWSAGDFSLSGQGMICQVPGLIGRTSGYAAPAQTGTFAVGTATSALAISLGSQTVTFNEGIILNAVPIGSLAGTFSVGTLTVTKTGSVTLALSAVTAQFSQGNLFDNVSYLLDSNLVPIIGQIANFTLGTIAAEVDYTAPSQSIASSEGTLSDNYGYIFPSLTVSSTEGTITATQGNNVTPSLGSLVITSSQGALGLNSGPNYSLTGQSLAFTLGNIFFSTSGDLSFTLQPQTINLKEGLLFATGPQTGTGPPLFIPPQLGKPVTTRTFSWAEMAMRAWGSEFRAPDHRIYQFSGGNYKDSTDMGTTGIYSPNLGVPDNP